MKSSFYFATEKLITVQATSFVDDFGPLRSVQAVQNNVIRTLTYRFFPICSTSSLLQAAIKDLRKLLLQNCYPQGTITFTINDVSNKNINKPNKPVQATVLKKDILILLISK